MSWIRKATDLFWLWTVLGTIWAWYVPDHFIWFLGKVPGTELKLTAVGLGIIMMGMGLTLTPRDFAEVTKVPGRVGLGVAAQFLLMPAIGWTVATVFALPAELKLGIILVCCCPGGTASNVVCHLARANVALSVVMTMTSTLLAVGLTPFLTKVYAASILEVDALKMVVTMVMIVLVPVLGGVIINHFFGRRLSTIKEVSPVVSVLVIVLIVGAIVGRTKDSIVEYAGSLLPAVFLVHLLGFSAGYLWAKVFRFEKLERRTVSIEVGMQNSGLGAELAKTHFTTLAATPCAISAFYHCLIGSFLASWWRRKD